ncbi:MAG: amino acid adenylation domain-containing protein, partial [Ferruginibacter sp.]|nr:amino acid adenylation domain-containing protein [Ferruginibacter sp.]
PLSVKKGEIIADFLKNETLASLFKQTVTLYPHKTALNFNEEIITYAGLDKWSDDIANTLQINGIGNGQFVGVWLPRGLQLHAAILGIIKAGAAYVPLDIDMPAERVLSVLTEVAASAYLSEDLLSTTIKKIILPLTDNEVCEPFKSVPLPDDNAYVIYTSGSTGKPKGIPITHRQICHFIRAEQNVLQINSTDKVYQGFSVSFDMWCEETWISYFAGATLFVADGTTAKAIDELTDFLNKNKITVLHAVPSLLGAMETNATTLRLINAGGEACNNQVLEKWKTPQRQFFNSYGPTETTVTATIAELYIGTKITIGKPLPNYNIAVINEQTEVLPKGEKGELVITGPGVSNGYINRADLNKEKFITNPIDENILPGKRMYKTGDAAVMNEDGSIDFHGRLDDQVKLRGYRIELGEIENSLASLHGVAAAAVALKKDSFSNDQLIAYVVLKDSEAFDEQLYKTALSKILPAYMVPLAIVPIEKLPRQPSGKIDRKKLPEPPQLLAADTIDLPPLGDDATIEEKVIYCLQKTFPNKAINLAEDFFTDLGGHSLLAATFISLLRKEGGLAKVSLKDIYLNRPLKAAVDVWQTREKETPPPYVSTFNKIPKLRYYTCWAAQTITLLIIFGLFATQIFIPYIGYYYVNVEHDNIGYALLTALILFCLIPPFFSLVIIATKWLVIGKIKEGNYPLWGTYYFRWWFVKTMQQLLPSQFLNGTPIYPAFLRMMGADVANDAQLSSFVVG